jgi:hypothetical protein
MPSSQRLWPRAGFGFDTVGSAISERVIDGPDAQGRMLGIESGRLFIGRGGLVAEVSYVFTDHVRSIGLSSRRTGSAVRSVSATANGEHPNQYDPKDGIPKLHDCFLPARSRGSVSCAYRRSCRAEPEEPRPHRISSRYAAPGPPLLGDNRTDRRKSSYRISHRGGIAQTGTRGRFAPGTWGTPGDLNSPGFPEASRPGRFGARARRRRFSRD